MRRSRRLLLIGNASGYGRGVIKGVLGYCRMKGRWEYRLERDIGPEAVQRTRTALSEWTPDGIIASVLSSGIRQLILKSGLPFVSVGGRGRAWVLPAVVADNVAAGGLVARHFLDNGFKNFVYFAMTRTVYSQARCKGFVAELATAGFKCEVYRDQDIPGAKIHWAKDRRKMDRWLISLPKPVGIMCLHDERALEVSEACERLGIRVPEQVALVGLGNEEIFCQLTNPPLSSVDQGLERIGYEAAGLLHRMLDGAKAPSKPILIPPHRLVIRQSSDIIAVKDPDIAAALRFIRERVEEPISVKSLLQKIPISRKTMERRFEELIGRSPRQEIARVRIDRAKSLLEETEFSVPAIARRVGFARQTFFSTFFHRETGLTPTQYRQNRPPQASDSLSHSDGAYHTNESRLTRQPMSFLHALSRKQQRRLVELGTSSQPSSRLDPSQTRGIILKMCQEIFLTAATLGELLHRNPNGLRNRFLKPMLDEELLQRKYPDEPNRPDQAYTATPQTRPTENTGAIP